MDKLAMIQAKIDKVKAQGTETIIALVQQGTFAITESGAVILCKAYRGTDGKYYYGRDYVTGQPIESPAFKVKGFTIQK
jgi:hypothetical protein